MEQRNNHLVVCPCCKHSFELSQAFQAHFEAETQERINAALRNQAAQNEEDRKEREEAIREKAAAAAQMKLEESAEREKALQEQLQANQEAQAKREDEWNTKFQQEQAAWALQEKQIQEHAREEAGKEFDVERQQFALEKQRLEKTVTDMQRQLGQGSMELQGEALEILLRDRLREAFPLDNIQDVGKGVTGADLRQSVINERLQDCGVIVWEAKDTKHWGKDWIDKIKTDAALAGAQVRVIVSRTLPKGVDVFDLVEGVWVCSIHAALSLAIALRLYLIESQRLQQASQGQGTKMEAIYAYLTSPLFRDRIQQIVDTYQSMKNQVSKERRAMESQWRTREKQLDRLISTTIEFRSDLEAVIGSEMLAVPGLELEALPPGEEADVSDPPLDS